MVLKFSSAPLSEVRFAPDTPTADFGKRSEIKTVQSTAAAVELLYNWKQHDDHLQNVVAAPYGGT